MATDVMLSNTGAVLMMSSVEIAELLGARHDSVQRTIQRLALKKVIPLPPAVEKPATGGRPGLVYQVSKRDSYVVVAQMSPEFTARLVDRWQELEDQQAAQPAIPQTLPEALRLAADLAEQNSSLRLVVSQQEPKVKALQQLADAAGTLCISDAAKQLSMQPKALIEWMSDNRWIFRRSEGKPWQAYVPRMTAGLLRHKTSVISVDDDGVQRIASQVRVTPKGLTVLAQKLGRAV